MDYIKHEPHKVGYYIGGIPTDKEGAVWKGRFHAHEEDLWPELESNITNDLEAVIIIDMINASQVYTGWWNSLKK